MPIPYDRPWKRRAKVLARSLLHRAGGLRGVRYWNRRGFRILMYHGFPSIPGMQEALAKQCDHMMRHYRILSLTEIGRYVREGKRPPPNALAVTVDDGNQNFFLNGYPVFHAHQIPVTVFLVSGFLDRQLWLWWDQIRYVLEKTSRSSFPMSLSPGRPPVTFTLETDDERQRAISAITEAVKNLGQAERHRVLNEGLFKLLDVELPSEPPRHMAPMRWSEVRQIAENGVDVGAHTVSHPMLSRLQDHQELVREIEDSKRRIEEEVHRPVAHFCYPYGHREDFNDETLNVLERCNFQTAVTTQHGLNFRESHPFLLKRLSVDAMLPEFYFQERLAGLHSG